MMTGEELGFPTQGELIRLAYAASGVLPGKRDEEVAFDAKARKTVHKALQRLAAEEGELGPRFAQMFKTLSMLTGNHISLAPLHLAIGEVISDLLDIYGSMIRTEGTYLKKNETIRWLLAERLVPAAAVSVARHMTRYGLRTALAGVFPDDPRWYLPDFRDGTVVWPLEKVMRWSYRQFGAGIADFHYPNRNAVIEEDVQRQRDLENAENWLSGRRLPSAGTLRWTFERGFSLQTLVQGSEPRSSINAERINGVQMALFIARVLTFLARDVAEHFGNDYLAALSDSFTRHFALALTEADVVEAAILQCAAEAGTATAHPHIRDELTSEWESSLRVRIGRAESQLGALHRDNQLTAPNLAAVAEVFGELAVAPVLHALTAPRSHVPPPGFVDAVLDGEELAKDKALSMEAVHRYEARLKSASVDVYLPWMTPWLRFLIHYRAENDRLAWERIQEAYHFAKYRAGSRQYPIVNHYIELAAKVDDWKEFCRGVFWATYIGLPVRWLRNERPSKENLRGIFQLMKKVRYGP